MARITSLSLVTAAAAFCLLVAATVTSSAGADPASASASAPGMTTHPAGTSVPSITIYPTGAPAPYPTGAPAPGATSSVPTVTSASGESAGTLRWRRCRGAELRNFQCATLTAALDWDRPEQGTTPIAMLRARSTGSPRGRIGSLFFNPGGPGGSGLLTAPMIYEMLPRTVTDRFDFVTWDPRGVGRSAGIDDCEPGEIGLPATGPVSWLTITADYRAATAEANARCQRNHPRIIDHMGTNMVVRDLDAMRAAVGDRSLTYWGMSYGTRIGYTYALTFPDRVRALVLDGSIDPNGSITDLSLGYGTAADSALDMMFQVFAGTSEQYRRAHRTLSEQPLRLPSGRSFTRWNLRNLLEESAGFERVGSASWVSAARWLDRITIALEGAGPEASNARKALDRLRPGTTTEGLGGATAVIDCIDYADRPTAAEQDAIARTTRIQAPISGWKNGLMMATQCEGLTVPIDPVPIDFGTDQSARLLLLGSTRDARTPYAWTAAMARAFPRSRVVTYVGGQHGDYLLSQSRCVDRRVNRYLVTRSLPAHDMSCPNAAHRWPQRRMR